MTGIGDKDILQAVARLRADWADLLGDEDARALAQWVEAVSADDPVDDPEWTRQIVYRILELVQQHPQAKTRLGSELGIKGPLEDALRLDYEPPPGVLGALLAGTRMVCPIDPRPEHCLKRLRQKGQVLYCAEHGVALVAADSITPARRLLKNHYTERTE